MNIRGCIKAHLIQSGAFSLDLVVSLRVFLNILCESSIRYSRIIQVVFVVHDLMHLRHKCVRCVFVSITRKPVKKCVLRSVLHKKTVTVRRKRNHETSCASMSSALVVSNCAPFSAHAPHSFSTTGSRSSLLDSWFNKFCTAFVLGL